MKKQIKKKFRGLKLVRPDERNFKFGRVFSLPKLEELPKDFILEPFEVERQRDTDFCTAEMSCYMSEIQEKIDLEPSWSFAASKKLSGDVDEYGQDLTTALKTHVKYGALAKKDSPYSLDNKDGNFLRNINNWPKELFDKAIEHKKKSFFEVSGPYDPFDNVRTNLFKNKSAVGFGVAWSWRITDIFIKDFKPSSAGHALTIVGWKTIDNEPYAIVQNSYGPEAGERGRHYFSREVINKFVGDFGGFIFVDMPKDTAKMLHNWGLSIHWNWLANLYNRFKDIF